jgi:hypothetical protein
MKWEGIESVRFARTYEDALSWAACYPSNAVIMIGKRGRMIGARF